MLRRASVSIAALLALTMVTGCSEPAKDSQDQNGASARSTATTPEESLEGQDKISDSWPREIPLPVEYEIQSASSPDGNIHALNVFAVSTKDVQATLAKFASNGFTKVDGSETGVGGVFKFENDEWSVGLIIGLSDANGEPTTEDTGKYLIGYNVGPVD